MIKWPIGTLSGASFCNNICMSVNEFGIKEPITVKQDGTVIDGKKRLAAARFLGYTVVPVRIIEDMEPPVDSRIKLPIEFPLYSFMQISNCKNRIYLKVRETAYLELQAGAKPFIVKEEQCAHLQFRAPEAINLKFKDEIVHSEAKVYDSGITTQVVAQFRKPCNHFKVHDIVRLNGGSHPYIITCFGGEHVFLKSLISGATKNYLVADSRLYTRQVVVKSDIICDS